MKSLLRNEWRLISLGFLLTFCSSPGQTFFISLFSTDIRQALSLSHAAFGSIYSLATVLSAVVMLWSGTLIDRIDLRKLVATVLICLAFSVALLGNASNAALLFIALFLLRQFGQSLMMLIASTTIVRYLQQQRGKATALSGMGYVSAEAILPLTIITLLTAFGWQFSLYLTALILLVVILPLSWWLLRNHATRHQHYIQTLLTPAPSSQREEAANSPQKQWRRGDVLKDICFYLFLPTVIAHGMLFTGFIFHQLHLVASKGWSLELWGSLFVMYACIGIVSKFITGYAVDKYGAIRLIPFGSLPMAAGLVALASFSGNAAAIAFMVGLGLSTGIQTTLSAPFWAELYGSQYLGSIKSLASATIVFGTALTPVLMGWLIDIGTSIDSLAVYSALYIIIAMGLAVLARRIHLVRMT